MQKFFLLMFTKIMFFKRCVAIKIAVFLSNLTANSTMMLSSASKSQKTKTLNSTKNPDQIEFFPSHIHVASKQRSSMLGIQ